MEFVTGDVLTQRISAAVMKRREALKIAIAIADAVAAAHTAGVVHRDLNLQTRAERVLAELPAQMRFCASQPIDVAPDGRSALISPVSRGESDLVMVDGIR